MLADDSTIITHEINQVQEIVHEKKGTRHDLLTYISAKEYLQAHHPKVLFLGFGETDEEAHKGNYSAYLQKAAMADKLIGDLFSYLQSDPFYKDNTTLIITTDHGRGNTAESWDKHNLFINGSGETWLAIVGPAITPAGEIKEDQQKYGNQLASTIAMLLGEKFEAPHKVGKAILFPLDAKEKLTADLLFLTHIFSYPLPL
jgi:arylsulfatase A-like enzyme